MALIFFEGFNRALRSEFWTLSPDSAGNRTPYVTGGGRIDGAGRLQIDQSIRTAGTSPTARINFGTHTAKKVYIGIGVQGWTVGDETMVKYLAFYTAPGAEAFSVWLDDGPEPAVQNACFTIKQGSSLIGSYRLTSATNTASSTFDGRGTVIVNSNLVQRRTTLNGWNYLEFEIDLNARTLAMRRNGMALYTQTGDALLLALPTNVLSLGALEISAASHPYTSTGLYDDLYIVDNEGGPTNTWLGPTATVYSPAFDPGGPLSPEQWSGAGGNASTNATIFNSDNGDVSYISTTAFDRVQAHGITLSPTPSNAWVAGITMATSARNVTLDSAYQQVYVPQFSSTAYGLSGLINLTGVTYIKTYNTVTINPATEQPWTVDDINNGTFGVKSVDPS